MIPLKYPVRVCESALELLNVTGWKIATEAGINAETLGTFAFYNVEF